MFRTDGGQYVQVSSTWRRKPEVVHSSDTVRMSSVPVSCKFTGRAPVVRIHTCEASMPSFSSYENSLGSLDFRLISSIRCPFLAVTMRLESLEVAVFFLKNFHGCYLYSFILRLPLYKY